MRLFLSSKVAIGQAVDEETEVESELGLVPAVPELAGHAEAIAREEFDGLLVVRRGCAVEEVDLMGPCLTPLRRTSIDAALRDLALQPREKAAPRRPVVASDSVSSRSFCVAMSEAAQLDEIDAVVAVVVLRVAEQPASTAGDRDRGLGGGVLWREEIGMPGHRTDDQVFEAAFVVSVVTPRPPPSPPDRTPRLLEVHLAKHMRFVDLVRQPGGSFTHVEFAGDDVGDQTRSVFVG